MYGTNLVLYKKEINNMKTSDNLIKALDILNTVASLDMTIVPIEPSDVMIDAAKMAAPEVNELKLKEIYSSMLLANDESMLI